MSIFTRIKNLIAPNDVVCYYRCSNKSIKEHIRQKFLCREYAEKNGYNIISEFAEVKSGNLRLDERDKLLDCITYCIKNRIKTILVSEVDRFSRNVQTAKDILAMVKPLGIRFIILDYNIDTSKGQKQIDKLLDVVELSHYELKKIKYRLDTGRAKYVSDGGKVGRKPGYKKPKEEMREEYSEVIKLLFESDGYSLRRISQKTGVAVNTIRKVKEFFKDEYNESGLARMMCEASTT